MAVKNILKGTAIFPTINLQGEEIGTQSFNDDEFVSGSVSNNYKGSFIISIDDDSLSTFIPITDSTADLFKFPTTPKVYQRSVKTLNLRLVQTGYSTVGDYYQSRSAHIVISSPPDPYLSPPSTIISCSEVLNPDQNSYSVAPWPVDYEQCVSFDTSTNRFIFKLVRTSGSTAELKQVIKGIYTLY